MKLRPQAVVFDLGKVLLDFDYGIAMQRLAPRVRLSLSELHALLNQSTLLFEYETGLLSTTEFFARVRERSGYAGEFEEFGASFADIFREIEPMTALHAELRRRGVPTYVLSNTNELAVRQIRRQFPFFSHFDAHVFSYEHRSMKPAPRLYEVVEELSGKGGAELLYFDDRPENVAAASARGWLAVLHDDAAASRAVAAEAGLLGGSPLAAD